MIKVLKNQLEIDESEKFLEQQLLPRHLQREKNWDLCRLYELVETMPRQAKIIDLGCGYLEALKFLHAMKFKNLYGVDLSITLRARLAQLTGMAKAGLFKAPFHLYRRDLTKTTFPGGMFDLAVCLSVVEHEIDLEKFLYEARRILKAGGLMLITTDYWEDKVEAEKGARPFGLAWKIFSKGDIENFITKLPKFGFSLYKDSPIPECLDKCVKWHNQEYTFLCIILRKI